MVRTIIQLTGEQSNRLKLKAKEQGISVAELIRRMVDTGLAVPDPDEELRKRALSVIGRFSSGTGDVAEKHNEYFVESVMER